MVLLGLSFRWHNILFPVGSPATRYDSKTQLTSKPVYLDPVDRIILGLGSLSGLRAGGCQQRRFIETIVLGQCECLLLVHRTVDPGIEGSGHMARVKL